MKESCKPVFRDVEGTYTGIDATQVKLEFHEVKKHVNKNIIP